ncbi:MAG TPA: hypothetical protein VHU22_06455 [Xanthobacteraceae bacterium]|jgi:hypothetical protein|nr:hypothetical protein [Xanthobacteraceae bacterium]
MGERIFAVCVAAFFGFLPYAVKGMPTFIAWIGLIGAVVIAALTFVPINPRLVLPAAVMIATAVGFIAAGAWLYERYNEEPLSQTEVLVRLGELGWTIKSEEGGNLLVEVVERSVPPMAETAHLLAQLNKPFRLHLQLIGTIAGLHYLADLPQLTNMAIEAGKFTDISELRGFTHLTNLTLSQIPYDSTAGVVDASPLSSLTNLVELTLANSRIRNADFLASMGKLRVLNLEHTPLTDISALSHSENLEKLTIQSTRITNLSALTENTHLELIVGKDQIPGLVDLPHLKKLSFMDANPTDLSPISSLTGLEALHIWGAQPFDISQFKNLGNLQELTLNGMGFGFLFPVANADLIGNFRGLKTLNLSSIQINDLSFLRNLQNLTELNLSALPITSLAPIESLKHLKKIWLINLGVGEISPLLALPDLSELYVLRVPARADVIVELQRRGVKVTMP